MRPFSFLQHMSLLPRTPSSRGLRPRNAALRLSFAGLRSARLPHWGRETLPQTTSPLDLHNTPRSTHQLLSNLVSTETGEVHLRAEGLRKNGVTSLTV